MRVMRVPPGGGEHFLLLGRLVGNLKSCRTTAWARVINVCLVFLCQESKEDLSRFHRSILSRGLILCASSPVHVSPSTWLHAVGSLQTLYFLLFFYRILDNKSSFRDLGVCSLVLCDVSVRCAVHVNRAHVEAKELDKKSK